MKQLLFAVYFTLGLVFAVEAFSNGSNVSLCLKFCSNFVLGGVFSLVPPNLCVPVFGAIASEPIFSAGLPFVLCLLLGVCV